MSSCCQPSLSKGLISVLALLNSAGCPAAAARAISEAILSSPASRISTVAISARVPLADLAGRPRPGGPPAPPVIDLGSAGPWGGAPGGARPAPVEQPLTDEDAEVVAAALRARAEAEAAGGVAGAGEGDEGGQGPPPLAALTLPASCNERLGRAAVAELVAALGALRGLQAVNGVGLEVGRYVGGQDGGLWHAMPGHTGKANGYEGHTVAFSAIVLCPVPRPGHVLAAGCRGCRTAGQRVAAARGWRGRRPVAPGPQRHALRPHRAGTAAQQAAGTGAERGRGPRGASSGEYHQGSLLPPRCIPADAFSPPRPSHRPPCLS